MLSQHSFQNQRMVYTGENGDCSRSKMTSTVLGMADVTCGTEGCHWRVTSDQDNHNSKLTWLSNSLYNSKFCKIANFTKKMYFYKKNVFHYHNAKMCSKPSRWPTIPNYCALPLLHTSPCGTFQKAKSLYISERHSPKLYSWGKGGSEMRQLACVWVTEC